VSQTPEAVVRAWFDEVWNKRDESAIERLMDPQAVAHGLGPETRRGPAGFKTIHQTFTRAFGNIHIDVERTVTEGDTCVALCHVTGTHGGHSLGAPPSNKDVDYWGMTMVRVKNGRIVEGWNAFDFLTMYQQMGWVGTPVLPAGSTAAIP